MEWTKLNENDNGINIVIIKAESGKFDCADFVVPDIFLDYSVYLVDVSEDESISNYSQVKNIVAKKLKKGIVGFIKYENLSACLNDSLCYEDARVYDFNSIVDYSNENIVTVFADVESMLSIGGWNEHLNSAEDYELLARGWEYELGDCLKAVICSEPVNPVFEEDFYTYAYVLARYLKQLKASGKWDSVLTRYVCQAQQYGISQRFAEWLEMMLTAHEEYRKLNSINPVLVFMGEQMCFGVLDEFAVGFAEALKKSGHPVILYDAGIGQNSKRDMKPDKRTVLYNLAKRHFRAVVGFQTSLFAEEMPDGNILGNVFDCPKFQFIFDHPLYISYYLMLPIKDYYVLAQDAGYARYVADYYDNVAGAYHLPPAGQFSERDGSRQEETEKIYDLSFVGSYHDYRERLQGIKSLSLKERRYALKLINLLKHNPKYSMEKGLSLILKEEGTEEAERILRDKRTFIITLHHMADAGRIIMFYYREKVISKLLASGIELHVFSDTWKKAPFADDVNLHIHPDVTYKNGLKIMEQSYMTLNIMSWHKEGMTERIANSMLNKAVCVSDTTIYLKEHFTDGENIVLFELDNIDELIGKIISLNKNRDKLNDIACNAYSLAMSEHTWDNRVVEFEKILTRANE
ncbi:MAG: glycosyltransferase [Lachnospira sp.]